MLRDLIRRRGWELAIAVLGLNLWVSFLLIPTLHRGRLVAIETLALVAAPLLVLAVGVASRNRWVLILAVPASMLLAVMVEPRLATGRHGVASFGFLTLAFVAYGMGTPLLLALGDAPAVPRQRREVAGDARPGFTRRQRWIHGALAGSVGGLGLVLVASLYLDPVVRAAMVESYPERAAAAAVLYGVSAIGVWLLVFGAFFLGPLKAHVRGDQDLKDSLRRQGHDARHGRVRVIAYVYVGAAIALLGAFALLASGR